MGSNFNSGIWIFSHHTPSSWFRLSLISDVSSNRYTWNFNWQCQGCSCYRCTCWVIWLPKARLTLSWWLISGKWMSMIGSGWDELIARSLTPSSTKLICSWPIPRCKRRFWALEWVRLAKQELRRTAIAIMVIGITLDIKHQSRRFQYILYGNKSLVLCIFRWDQLLAVFSTNNQG